MQNFKKPNREYKDTLFRYIFSEKDDLLQLYNAVNGTDYKDATKLEITTLEDVIYLSYKNDVSFLIGNTMNLYEHQSTLNRNMPVRGLIYFGELYSAYIDVHNINIYSPSLKKLPMPQYIVFYNGAEDLPERFEMKLSDAFETCQDKGGDYTGCDSNLDEVTGRKPCLEIVATVLNINLGNNREIMEKCKKLLEYSQFVAFVKEYLVQGMTIAESLDLAAEKAVRQDILKDVLQKQRAEVLKMFMRDFDEERYRRLLREEYREEGLAEGRAEGRAKGIAEGRAEGIRVLIETYKELDTSREDTLTNIQKKFNLEESEAEQYMEKYWI